MQRLMLLLLLQLFVFVGCGGPSAPLALKNAKWFDFSDPKNARPLDPNVSAETLSKLKGIKLDLGGNELIVDSDLATIRGCKNLAMLDLYLTKITDKSMEHLVDLPLEVLVINQTELGDEALVSIGKIKTLRRLELFDTNVTDAGLKHIIGLPLFRIDLSKTSVTNAGMEDVAKIAGLERLILSNTSISDAGLAPIGTIDTLQELSLYQSGEITDVGLKHLHNLKSLKALFLGDSRYTPEGLRELRSALPRCQIAAND